MKREEFSRILDMYVCACIRYHLDNEKYIDEAIFHAFETARRMIEKRETILKQLSEEGKLDA